MGGHEAGYSLVRTAFLAMNMTLSNCRRTIPLLFKTRLEGGWLDDQWERYSTLDEAEAGHEAWVARVATAEENGLPPPRCPAS